MKHFCSFSEAIREGAKLRPQGFQSPTLRAVTGTSCALEAGIEAIGCEIDWADQEALCVLYPYLNNNVPSPLDNHLHSLFDLCWELNDEGWAREAIADWLEKEEEKLGFVTIVEAQSTAEIAAAVSGPMTTERALHH